MRASDLKTLRDGECRYFIKLNVDNALPMFEAEAAALRELAAVDAIRVPRPIHHGLAGRQSYLVLEALDFGAVKSGSY
mgnify:CR=1 FL=1